MDEAMCTFQCQCKHIFKLRCTHGKELIITMKCFSKMVLCLNTAKINWQDQTVEA